MTHSLITGSLVSDFMSGIYEAVAAHVLNLHDLAQNIWKLFSPPIHGWISS